MPNWCSNHLNIEGEGAGDFIKACYGQEAVYKEDVNPHVSVIDMKEAKEPVFTMNALYPVPEEVLQNGYSNSSAGDMSGYHWQANNWGTKWDFGDVDIHVDDDNNHAFINFDTAWAPPIGWVAHVAQQFPHLTFTLEYYEPGVAFAGRLTITGDDVNDDYYDYSQDEEGYKRFVAEELEYGWEEFEGWEDEEDSDE